MSDQGSGGDNAIADAIAKRARARQGRDKELVEASREGDRTAFGKLYDLWVDHVYDCAVNGGASAAEARVVTEQTFLTVWQNLGRLRQPAAIGAKILQVTQRQSTTHVHAPGPVVATTAKPGEAEDRLTRTTDAVHAASDPDVAAVLRDASLALDDRTRAVLDLHFRQGLTASEVGAVVGMDADGVKETITKLPTALGVLTRARVLWRGGEPLDEELAGVLAEEHITAFDAATVRTINKFAKDHDRARARSMIAVAPVALYAAIPLAAAPAGLKMAVAELLVTEGVPMDGSAFVKRDDRGEILAKPKEKRADLNVAAAAATVRPSAPSVPSVDKKKAAAVAAAALAAEAVVMADETSGATTLIEPLEDDRKSRVSERFRARKGAAAASVLESTDAHEALDSIVPAEHGANPGGPEATDAGSGAGDDRSNGFALPPLAAAGAVGLADLDAPPSPADLDARAQGEAAAMGRAYTPPASSLSGDGDGRAIPGAAHLDRDDNPNRKKALIIGGAVAAAVVLLGGTAFAMRGGSDDTKTAGGGPRPTNPAPAEASAAATTTIPATTTTAIVTTTLPEATTTLAPDTTPTTVAPTSDPGASNGGGGGGGTSSGGGGAITPTTAAPAPTVVANTAQAATGAYFIAGERRIQSGYSMVASANPGLPTLTWDLKSTAGFTVTVTGPGVDPVARGQAGSVALCPGTASPAGICTANSGEYTYTLVINAFDGSTRSYSSVPLEII